ncbi:MAG: WD40-repeat-containing domain protein [Benjaminiella poitrasii]|nr:MAG: WD40-repeat-containing domain protein [Benjaminiella poitrasii]
MAPVSKKAKTEATEKELESLLFGNNADDMWDQTGHELEIKDEETKNESGEDEEEEEQDNEEAFFFDSGPVTFTLDVPTIGGQASDSEIDYEAEEENNDKTMSLESDSEDNDDSDDDESDEDYAAWEDEDDKNLKISLMASNLTKKLRNDADEDVVDGVEYTRRLRKQFNKIYPKPDWARLPSEIKAEERKRKATDSDDEDEDENADRDEDELDNETRLDLLKSTMGILDKRSANRTISPKKLDIMRLKNANRDAPKSKIPITCIAFHPNAQVLMTAGLDKTLRLFQIDGKINPKIQSIRFKDMPIYHAEFHPSGDQIVVCGRRPFFYIYDIQMGVVDKCPGIWGREERSLEKFSISPCGRYIAFLGTSGTIIIVSYVTKQWFCDLKMNGGSVQSVDWSSDGKYIFGFNNVGEVYQFNVQDKECVKRWNDDGCIGASVISVSPNEKYYATGSSTGVVNLYDRSVLDPNTTNPKPIKAIQNLTTRINNIVFSHDSQLMVISSQLKKDQLRIIHVPTATAYSNWPTDRTPLNDVIGVAFSPNSDYLAISSTSGRVLLYTLKHYALK